MDQHPSRDDRIAEIIAEFSEVFAASRANWARYAEEVHPDLRGTSMLILQIVLRKAPVTATELSQILEMDKATVSRQVSKLRELGLVEAEPSEEDRRVTVLTVSESASELLQRIRERWARSYHERFVGWDLEELARLQEALRRFNESAEVLEDGPARRCTRGADGARAAD
ncbi:MarR family winged helix-turn-helix transcriptional regulator [Gulosibacter sp. 10]|uniref:MarR family winged helix-turn-helix transcriptional regulator n=1 Tax=Gulosibacter sp. 10 TaxID=1255570 RepID=UPI00097F2599|nr:MarR family transcriptional regulator [Gulosibacter sp. 10]SJM61087.1 Transcriptional regulator, MarR family [Gulosibacter sp. 10]